MSVPQDLFGEALAPDPSVALPSVRAHPPRVGPVHRAQFVIEFVGPRSVPASAASGLLSAEWYAALGEPEVWAMSAADNAWRPLTVGQTASFDSLAVSWDAISEKGKLSSASAGHLFGMAEQFAGSLNRRAIPLPVPQDVDRFVSSLEEIQQSLDVGVSIMVLSSRGMAEKELWIQCAKLGLQMSPEGSFDWLAPGHPSPLFSVTPVGNTDRFTLAGVSSGEKHQGVTLGFSVPLSPNPARGAEGMLQAAYYLMRQLGGFLFDQDGQPLESHDSIRQGVQQAAAMLEQAGISPGSAEAIKLFA